MNLQESITHLRKIGWHVSKEGEKYRAHRIGYKAYCNSPVYKLLYRDEDYNLYSPRELISKAKAFSSESKQETAIKKKVKAGQKKKERPKVRDTLSTFNEDEIDNLDTKKLEDRWFYD